MISEMMQQRLRKPTILPLSSSKLARTSSLWSQISHLQTRQYFRCSRFGIRRRLCHLPDRRGYFRRMPPVWRPSQRARRLTSSKWLRSFGSSLIARWGRGRDDSRCTGAGREAWAWKRMIRSSHHLRWAGFARPWDWSNSFDRLP